LDQQLRILAQEVRDFAYARHLAAADATHVAPIAKAA